MASVDDIRKKHEINGIERDEPNLLIQSKSELCGLLNMEQKGPAVVVEETKLRRVIPNCVQEIRQEYPTTTQENTTPLPPVRTTDHRIDLVLDVALPNLAHY